MDDVMVNFYQILRRCGLRVSVSESLDGTQAASAVGMKDRGVLKAALRSSLVKKTKDIPLFDEIFDAYFTDKPSDIPIEERFGHGLKSGEGDEEFDEAMRRALEQMGGLDELTQALLQGNIQFITAEMLQHMSPEQLAELQTMFQRGQLVRLVLDKMGWQKIQEQLRELIKQLYRQGDHPAAYRVQQRLWELQELFPKWVAGEVNERVQKQFQAKAKHKRPSAPKTDELMHKDFGRYSEAEIEAMEEIVDQLARKLREDWARRAKQGGRKRLDVPRTMRAAMGTDGVPMDLHWKQKRRNKLNLAVLCDVSSSVRNASRFMLQLVYSLQQQRGRVRSFVFISDLAEVTEAFERNTIEKAVHVATTEADITYLTHSDFGNSFRHFLDQYSDAITSRTTVIMLGDGRNNYHDPQIEAVQEIKERARRFIWLNPENKWGWGWGDSIAPLYAQYCDQMVECRNLAQLTEAMEYLIESSA